MSTRPLLAAACALGLLAGCENTVMYTPIIHPDHALASRGVDTVEVFAITPPARPHKDIGIFQIAASHFSEDPSTERLIADARKQAAQLGCDAIVVTSVDNLSDRYHSSNIQAGCLIYDR
jgi:hypothetical protein